MPSISTARILANKTLLHPSGQECVDWAISMLESGRDGRYLAILASLTPPFNHFEVSDYRDRSLRELGINDLSVSEALSVYSAELLRNSIEGKADLECSLRDIKDLCITSGYDKNIFDFYLLYFAYIDLQAYNCQHYWKDANRENIVSIIHQRAEVLFQSIQSIK